MEELTNRQCLDLLKECWDTFGGHVQTLTTDEKNDVDELLRMLGFIISED